MLTLLLMFFFFVCKVLRWCHMASDAV